MPVSRTERTGTAIDRKVYSTSMTFVCCCCFWCCCYCCCFVRFCRRGRRGEGFRLDQGLVLLSSVATVAFINSCCAKILPCYVCKAPVHFDTVSVQYSLMHLMQPIWNQNCQGVYTAMAQLAKTLLTPGAGTKLQHLHHVEELVLKLSQNRINSVMRSSCRLL